MAKHEPGGEATEGRGARDPIGAEEDWLSTTMSQTDDERLEDAVDAALDIDPQAPKEARVRQEEAREREVRKRFG